MHCAESYSECAIDSVGESPLLHEHLCVSVLLSGGESIDRNESVPAGFGSNSHSVRIQPPETGFYIEMNPWNGFYIEVGSKAGRNGFYIEVRRKSGFYIELSDRAVDKCVGLSFAQASEMVFTLRWEP
jgi:hypothetical protein